jgi:hypothetical protein
MPHSAHASSLSLAPGEAGRPPAAAEPAITLAAGAPAAAAAPLTVAAPPLARPPAAVLELTPPPSLSGPGLPRIRVGGGPERGAGAPLAPSPPIPSTASAAPTVTRTRRPPPLPSPLAALALAPAAADDMVQCTVLCCAVQHDFPLAEPLLRPGAGATCTALEWHLAWRRVAHAAFSSGPRPAVGEAVLMSRAFRGECLRQQTPLPARLCTWGVLYEQYLLSPVQVRVLRSPATRTSQHACEVHERLPLMCDT